MVDSFYKAVNREEISKLPFLGKEVPYYFSSGKTRLIGGVVYRIERDAFEKAKKRISGENHIVKPGDKVYVMYKNDVPKFKIEEHCKRIGATIVSDYRKANIILGSKNMAKDRMDKLQSATSLIFSPYTLYTINNKALALTSDDNPFEPEATESFKEYNPILNPPIEGIFETDDAYQVIMSSNVSTEYLGNTGNCYITPLGISMLYWILKNGIPVVSESAFSSQISGAMTIDETIYENIISMLKSKNADDVNLGTELLANCNIEDSIYYIYKIADKFPSYLQRSDNKNVRLFAEVSNYNEIARMGPGEFVEYLRKKSLLTQEILDKLVPDITKEFKDDVVSDIFDIVLVPKEEYKDFKIESTKITLNKQTEDD